jgi:putative chitinase
LAKQYERKPEMIGSRVYANRMGNGDEASKEGFKFRGRGFIQLTGKG